MNDDVNKTSTIRGVVKDKSGEPVAGVNVILSSDLIPEITTISDDNGRFRFIDLFSGTYSITAILEGFATQKIEDVLVKEGEDNEIEIILKMGALEEAVELMRPAEIFAEPMLLSYKETPSDLANEIEDEISKLSVGKIMFNPPTQMKAFESERIEARISQNIKEDLVKGLKGRGIPQIEDIHVGAVMTTKLMGKDFNIESLSEEEQMVSSSGFTQWDWNVTPLKSGKRILCLSVSVSIYLDEFGEKKKSLPVMEKVITVKVNMPRSLFVFIKRRWVAIITIIIGLIGLFISYMQFIKK